MAESFKNDYKDDNLRWDLLPLDLIEEVVKVYHFGAKKYAPNSWQNLPDGYARYKGALFRHLVEVEKGNERDSESGLLHIQHVVWNAIAMMYYKINKNE